MDKAKIYTSYEKVDGITLKTEKATGLQHMSFIDTGLKFFGHKVYEGYSYLDDGDYRMFSGYFMKADLMQLDNRRGSKKVDRKIGKTFKHFEGKSSKKSWQEWFEIMSQNDEICIGKLNKLSLVS